MTIPWFLFHKGLKDLNNRLRNQPYRPGDRTPAALLILLLISIYKLVMISSVVNLGGRRRRKRSAHHDWAGELHWRDRDQYVHRRALL